MPTAAPYDDRRLVRDGLPGCTAGGANVGGFADRLGIERALVELPRPGPGVCLEVGCGTGVRAQRVAELGWTPIGIDLSTDMLRHAAARLPVAQAYATLLPVPDWSLDAVIAVMVHTDLPEYRPALDEVWRTLRPGGRFAHVGIHPCFCGGFANRADRRRSWSGRATSTDLGRPSPGRTRASGTRVGASHMPMAELFNTVCDSGFELQRASEGGEPTPIVLSLRACRALRADPSR